MTMGRMLVFALVSIVCARAASPQQTPPPSTNAVETIAAIRVHGNHTTPDADVVRLAAVDIGRPFTPAVLETVASRLRASGRFRQVEVRKRYHSLTDTSAIVLVIVVEEQAGISVSVPSPGPLRRLQASTMWLPVLRYEEGYGFTYGARVTLVELLGRGTRVSAPLTWGGERRAAVEVDRTFERGPITRLEATGAAWRRVHPAQNLRERRNEATFRAERALTSAVRLGASSRIGDITFGPLDEQMRTFGVDAALDTRRDPAFPRNAVCLAAGVERLWFGAAPDTYRVHTDLRGYLGLLGQTVLALRAQHVWSADALPLFEQPLLGGAPSIRGFRFGYRAGDRLTSASAELRVPFSSPLSVGRAGIAAFVDSGAVYDAGERLGTARFDTGIGAGFFLHAAVASMRLDVARGLGASTRAHFSFGVRF